jgi:hypothetical protein
LSEIFTDAWMKELMKVWNGTPKVHEPLEKASFNARIGYGFKGEPKARGLLVVVNGKVQAAGLMDGGDLDWDLRAAPESWDKWIKEGFGLSKLGPAVAGQTLQFAKGNYRQMIQNLSLSQPFLEHFELMRKI